MKKNNRKYNIFGIKRVLCNYKFFINTSSTKVEMSQSQTSSSQAKLLNKSQLLRNNNEMKTIVKRKLKKKYHWSLIMYKKEFINESSRIKLYR